VDLEPINNGLILVSGPVKSGKSRFAEKLVSNIKDVTYLATHSNNSNDIDWIKRINDHKLRRPKHWNLVESSDFCTCIKTLLPNHTLLVDSLGGIVSSKITIQNDEWFKVEQNIIRSTDLFTGKLVIVVEEAGWGVSPHTKLGNLFRDRLAALTDKLDNLAVQSWLVVHGRAINLFANSIRI